MASERATNNSADGGGAPGRGHETRDISPARVAVVGLLVLALLGLSAWLLSLWLGVTGNGALLRGEHRGLAALDEAPRLGALEVAPEAARAQLERAQRLRLHGWRWIDRDAGVAHVPIEAAMQAIAAAGDVPYPLAETAPARPAAKTKGKGGGE